MKIDFCTIASANYLPRVRVLQQSLKTHHPESRLHVLLCEQPGDIPALAEEAGVEFISPDQVCGDWRSLAFRYGITEFNTALKPFLLEYLLTNNCDAAIYLDPDIEVFSSLQSVLTLFDTHDLILTPHVCLPMDVDGQRPGIDETIRAGIYNLGFIGISGNSEARAALRWWRDVCRDYCYFDANHRYFVDQFWAAALPAFIQKFHCLRDPGCNVAYWNISQRRLTKANDRWLVDGGALRFFHFSGLPEDPRHVSHHQDRVTAEPGSDLYELLSSYRTKMLHNSWSTFGSRPYTFGLYSDDTPIDPIERRAFDALSLDDRSSLGDPFAQPIVLRKLGAHLIGRSRLSLLQKYFRLLAADGVIVGHRTLLLHLAGRLLGRFNRTRDGT